MVSPVNPGKVEWSGENPGIYLKDDEGNWKTLAVFFKVVTSPLGGGLAYCVLGAPFQALAFPAANNVCVTDNQPLMQWLIANFVSRFPSFGGAAALGCLPYLPATSFATTAESTKFHQESISGNGIEIVMRWEDLAEPFAVDVAPAMSATGQHVDVQRVRRGTARHYHHERRFVAGQNYPEEFSGPADEHCVSRFLRDLDYPATLIAHAAGASIPRRHHEAQKMGRSKKPRDARRGRGLTRRTLLKSAVAAGAIASIGPWFVKDAFSSSGELTWFTWDDYEPKPFVEQFTKDTGIKLNMQIFTGNEDAINKMRASRGQGYDLVTPGLAWVSAGVDFDFYQPIDTGQGSEPQQRRAGFPEARGAARRLARRQDVRGAFHLVDRGARRGGRCAARIRQGLVWLAVGSAIQGQSGGPRPHAPARHRTVDGEHRQDGAGHDAEGLFRRSGNEKGLWSDAGLRHRKQGADQAVLAEGWRAEGRLPAEWLRRRADVGQHHVQPDQGGSEVQIHGAGRRCAHGHGYACAGKGCEEHRAGRTR